MAYGKRVAFEAVREVAFGGIGAAYAALGAATIDNTRIITFHNTTDADVYITMDLTIDQLRIAAGSDEVYDFTANKVRDDGFLLEKNTTFYVKHAGVAPTTGNVWIHSIYAEGGI